LAQSSLGTQGVPSVANPKFSRVHQKGPFLGPGARLTFGPTGWSTRTDFHRKRLGLRELGGALAAKPHHTLDLRPIVSTLRHSHRSIWVDISCTPKQYSTFLERNFSAIGGLPPFREFQGVRSFYRNPPTGAAYIQSSVPP